MRLRLLDLTNRNRLLNFPLERPTKTKLRVVDELPDALFGQLIDGRELVFKAVPRPRPTASRPDTRSLAAIQHAQELGIACAFDLPVPGRQDDSAPAARHVDRQIQTLHYPEELESILRKISGDARLAIEETGSNMLYLAFGLLEWYERNDVDTPHFAPLVLLPASLRKGDNDPATDTFRYAVSYSGEEILGNVSLQERLKRDFGIQLPDFEEDDTPERYFARLGALLRESERWRVRRQVVLTLLSFGKLLMYRDLDPATWPKGKGPADHERVKEFFHGAERSGESKFAPDYSLDQPDIRHRVPPIVDEADSSQHSALVDALEGKNLVIAGPPGTGKSQTITNLIAAALAKGKSVLFVSEKLAALEVVRHRLDRVGLGAFCLELHSHKTQKRQLLDDLDKRIRLRGTFQSAAALDAKLRILEEDRQALTDYADLINRPFGAIGNTLFEVLWSARRRAATLECDKSLVENAVLPDASRVTIEALSNLRQVARTYARHLDAVLDNYDSVPMHPWYGCHNAVLTFADTASVVEKLSAFRAAVVEVNAYAATVSERAEFRTPESSAEIEAFAHAVESLPSDAGNVFRDVLPRLRDPAFRRRLLEFGAVLQLLKKKESDLHQLLGVRLVLSTSEIETACVAHERIAGLAPNAHTIADVDSIGLRLLEGAEDLQGGVPAIEQVLGWLGMQSQATYSDATRALLTLDCVRICPTKLLRFRHSGLEEEGAEETLSSADERATALRERRDTLSRNFDLPAAPPLADLQRHLRVATEASWWSFLSRDYRETRRDFRALSRDTQRPSREVMVSGFRSLVEFFRAEDQFVKEKRFRIVAGPHLAGIDTPFDLLREVAKWRSSMRGILAPLRLSGQAMLRELWNASADEFTALREAEEPQRPLTTALSKALQSFAIVRQELQKNDVPSVEDSLEALATEASSVGKELVTLYRTLCGMGFPAGTALPGFPRTLSLLVEAASLREQAASYRDVEDALGSDAHGLSTDHSRIFQTVQLCDSLNASAVAKGLVAWLLVPQIDERLKQIHGDAARLRELDAATSHQWRTFAVLGDIRWGEWHRDSLRQDDVPFCDMINRADRSLEASDHLGQWFDYLRARESVEKVQLERLVHLGENRELTPQSLVPAFEFIFANSLAREALQGHPVLARFNGVSHDQVRQRFVQIDREVIDLERQRAAYAIDQRRVSWGNGYGPVSTYTDLTLLDHEIQKQKRHIPVRQLVNRAGRALQALKPCFMMGPLSVAQYLAPGTLDFDLIVMDEASQLRPEDALGAIARGRQIVVVGDRMQLPPTSFFDRVGDEEAEEEELTADAMTDAESILDVATTIYRPQRLLRWHYRSRHGSLIAFSNKEFYGGELVVFPSPISGSPEFGVKLIRVSDGRYESRQNLTEAQRVVATALRHMRLRPGESLGIVTMNLPQRELIQDLLEEELKRDEIAQRYIASREGGLEPLFVKNLENVQGDERDVIYISVTYGPDAYGNVYQRFGPINGPTGHRRLNVLFTRARNRVVLFSSLSAEDVQLQPTSQWGVKVLKGYLHFAQTGVLEQASFSGREPDSDFEIEVADALRARGLEVNAQIGVAGYFIDLAVKHPTKVDSFILGIECDGRTYHTSRSARDRDRLRQQVLENLGWSIHRIWSTDWYKHPAREVDRIAKRIDVLLREEAAIAQTEVSEFDEAQSAATAVRDAAPGEASSWMGEEAEQPMSPEEAARLLNELAAEISERFPNTPPEARLLRQSMVEQLLRQRPRSRGDWPSKIQLAMRLDTEDEEVQAYLDRVLAITARLAR